MKEYLLFDLDGTLTDPKLGITTCVQYALKAFGIEEPDLDKLEPFIGPPLKDSFMQFYGFDDGQADAAVAKYRERFNDIGLFENELYPGIADMLRSLKKKGMHLAVASSKPTVFVERILEHFKIKQYFEVIVGSELDGRRVNKDEVVQEALRQLFGDKPVEHEKIYMIGDRKFDVEGARAQQVESVGVSYGYGSLEELKEAGADYIVRSVEELKWFLFREFVDIKPKGFSQIVLPILYPFLLMVLVKWAADHALPSAPVTLSGNVLALIGAFLFVLAGVLLRKPAAGYIRCAKDDMFLTHLRPEPSKSYMLLSLAGMSGVIGLCILLNLTGVLMNGTSYRLLLVETPAASRLIALLCSGIVIPVIEEIVFRGMLYNIFRHRTKLSNAIVFSALLYGVYHMNLAQGVYAFVIGCLLAYTYEYFGTILMPVVLHILSAILVLFLTGTSASGNMLYSLPACVLFLIVAAVSMLMLTRAKKIQ